MSGLEINATGACYHSAWREAGKKTPANFESALILYLKKSFCSIVFFRFCALESLLRQKKNNKKNNNHSQIELEAVSFQSFSAAVFIICVVSSPVLEIHRMGYPDEAERFENGRDGF